MERERTLARHASGAEPAGTACRVLFVEDNPDLAETMQTALEEAGLRVRVTACGDRAHAAYERERPDCVVLDLMLPGRSGFDVCQAIKRTNPAAPVIMLTGIDASESRELARLVGADGYLVKPIDPARLVTEIRAAVRRDHGPHPNGHAAHPERVVLQCRCGRRFQVSAAHRGKRLPCPTCGESLAVPRA
jgi:DNA-binding response OmpR family regulator